MILNLTQHAATAEQIAADVADLTQGDAEYIRAALTAESLEDLSEDAKLGTPEDRAAIIADRAREIADQTGATHAMIGGAPWLMSALERALAERGIKHLYAFSRRVVIETAQPDGTVKKTALFKHEGFVEL